MSYGIQVTNGLGDVVIDQDFRNHKLLSEGSVTPSQMNEVCTYSFLSLDDGVPICMARLPNTSGRVCNVRLLGSPGNWTGVQFFTHNFVGQQIDLCIFDRNGAGRDDSTHGLQVWDGGGNLVFDSGYRYLSIDGSVSFFGSPQGEGTSFSVPDAGVFVQLYNLVGFAIFTPSRDVGVFNAAALNKVSDTEYRVIWQPFFNGSPYFEGFQVLVPLIYYGVFGRPTN